MQTSNICSALVGCLLFISINLSAQFSASQGLMQLKNDDVSKLRDLKTLNVVLNFDSMQVGKFSSEEEYLASRKAELGNEEKYQKFETKWNEAKKTFYGKKFVEPLNKILSKKYFESVVDQNAGDITLHFITLRVVPGFGSPGGNSTSMDARCIITQGKNTLAVYTFEGISSTSQESYDMSERIGGTYYRAGLLLAKDLKARFDEK